MFRSPSRANARTGDVPIVDLTDAELPVWRHISSMSIDQLLTRRPVTMRGIGVVAPYDFALDHELWRWVPDDVALHITRTPWQDASVNVNQARLVSNREVVTRCTQDVTKVDPLAVGYACTSGSFVDGPAGEMALRAAMLAGGAPKAITATGALVSALYSLDVSRVRIVTPYLPEVTERLEAYLRECGITTTSVTSMGLDSNIWQVSYADVVRSVLDGVDPQAEAVFISCTNLGTYDVIAPLERELGKPVLSANQVMMWGLLRETGIPMRCGENTQMLVSETFTRTESPTRPKLAEFGSL